MTDKNQEQWHPEAFLQNRWTVVYRRLILNGQGRQKQAGYEEHHIVPESFFTERTRTGPSGWLTGNPDEPNNLVWLSWREHRLAHRLLRRIALPDGESSMRLVEWWMIHSVSPDGSAYRIPSREYERLRQSASAIMSRNSQSTWDSRRENPEAMTEFSAAMRALGADPDWLQSVSEGTKKALADPIVKARAKAGQTRRNSRPDESEKRSASSIQSLSRPEVRARLSESIGKWANSPENLARLCDPTVYQWTHKDGTTFTGTRREHSVVFGYTNGKLKGLFLKTENRVIVSHGWRVSPITQINT